MFNYVPSLHIQRGIYKLPRSPERFNHYVDTMIDEQQRVKLPLQAMNPMAKEHVPACIDRWLLLKAEDAAAKACQQADDAFGSVVKDIKPLKLTAVVADDVAGGWTNRVLSDCGHRQDSLTTQKFGWLVVLLWAGDEPNTEALRQEVLVSCYRACYQQRHGKAKTLAQLMRQEGLAARFAGRPLPKQDLTAEAELIAAYRQASDMPSIVSCLYGDAAATEVGYKPLGLGEQAGYLLAYQEAASLTEHDVLEALLVD